MKEFPNATWPRVKTTRRYLHCPKSERMYTLFAEGKVIFGEITEGNNGEAYWDEVFCSGVWFTHGDNNEAFDFKECVNVVDKNGIPVHAIRHKFSGIDVIIEAFSVLLLSVTLIKQLDFLATSENASIITSIPENL